MIIPMPPASLTFPTTSKSLNFSSSSGPRRLNPQHLNDIATHPLPQPNPSFPKYDTIAAAVLWPL